MTRKPDNAHEEEHLDRNLDRLIRLGEPGPKMPETLKAQIRDRLGKVGHGPSEVRSFPGRWAGWTIAAAAVLAFLIFSFWPGGSQAAISWSDVLEHLETVNSLTASTCSEITTTVESRTIHRARIYFQDPGLSRTELYRSGDEPGSEPAEIASVTIIHRELQRAEQLTLHPGSDQAERVTHTFRNDDAGPPTRPIIDLAAESWERLGRITAGKTRKIGEKLVDGFHATGFEVPASEFFQTPGGAANKGRIRIWAGSEDAIPRLIELEFIGRDGRAVNTEISNISWNPPLEEDLFDLTVPVDWQLRSTRIDSVEYTLTRLAPHVSLHIGPQGGDPLTGTADICSLVDAEQISHPGTTIPDTVRVTLELKPAAARRLRDHAESSPDDLLVVDFNGEVRVVPRLSGPHPNRISFDLSLLELSLEELEKNYFITR